ncbi:hypothetical protein A6F68_01363 [Tsuneonella dongtanensis]|uniref:DUF4139 domain-containing protein n=1 Tax=Tsuneonella dongtanensis TaxID=692370 RepID=A0A1B2ACJ1_9SPHN|nr:hypothetical protein [Tsuneonella dongtanensis]ANY19880.1 hypothetical protein A6F68_01363 [Tsuneonella dongtanensis]
MRRLLIGLLLAGIAAPPLVAREAVDASEPTKLAVTVYRDPNRGPDEAMRRDWPQGFAMISETRQVTLPPGESTIRFEGVSEGLVAVTAIVTGLPGGTIEKNRNADLLSPGALVDGTLGNRVTVTRTNPATGEETRESAIVRTRADGGLVLQTSAGFEAVGCSGVPEKLAFDRVPAGLSARPVYSIDTASPQGGTYTVTLTYLSWGFDWQAHYVATLDEGGSADDVRMRLTSWLTLVNDNNQTFADAQLMAVAGRLKVESDFRGLSDPPDGKPLQLICYPLGRTADGSPLPYYRSDGHYPPPPPPPPPPAAVTMMEESAAIMVTGSRMSKAAMVAREEDLADLKLYRVPEPVTVSAQSQKQVAFLERESVEGKLWHTTYCAPWRAESEPQGTRLLLTTVNDRKHGLGLALPTGGITVFESTPDGELLVGEERLRDYAAGQDVEIEMGTSAQVFAACSAEADAEKRKRGDKVPMKLVVTNANPSAAKLRVTLGGSAARIGGLRGVRIKDGARIYETTVPANGTRELRWTIVDE